mmetsp:Transcript_65028/g.170297  ORF Transcript_65028/g.170297 Transcript_65028/m.170297 type:complete len:239 (+) Transcript_65028:464-1180(+)
MPKSVSFTCPARLWRMFSGLISLWRSFLLWRYLRPSMICCVTDDSIRGSTPPAPHLFLRSAKLPRSMNSSTTFTALVFLETKPAYHCTRFGQPSARIRPLMSFKSCSRFNLSSTLTVLMATWTPVFLMIPFETTPQAPAPSLLSRSISMSSGDSLYSCPSKVMPSSVETFMPVCLWRMVPLGPIDHVPDTKSPSTSSSSKAIMPPGGIFAERDVIDFLATQWVFCSDLKPVPASGTPT